MRRIFLIYLFLFGIFVNITLCQDPNFSNFEQNPLYYNPAFPGLVECMDFRVSHRNQWYELPGTFNTTLIGASIKLPPPLGCGILLASDEEGEGYLKTIFGGIGTSLSFKVDNNKTFSLGYMVKVNYKKIDWSKLEFDDQYDELYGKIYPTSFIPPQTDGRWFVDPLNLGFMFRYEFRQKQIRNPIKQPNLTIGYSLSHGTKPIQSLLGVDRLLEKKSVFHMNGLFWFNEKYGINPGIIYESQSDFETITFGSNLYFGPLYLSNWIRNKNFKSINLDSYIFGGGITSVGKQKYMLGLSYDFTLSKLKGGTNGTIELFLSAELTDKCLFKSKKKSKSYIKREREKSYKCPEEPWLERIKKRIKFA
ncbi:MAG: PorP/SprF family type IX secretion system membrane protein [Bacteroidota bacterium]|nr:PorP/SprF family type IX secretion system membrane protein [Bacteroidota bacterium]